jgi:hypothetical protein
VREVSGGSGADQNQGCGRCDENFQENFQHESSSPSIRFEF